MALFETLLLLPIPVWSIKMLISKYLFFGNTWFWDSCVFFFFFSCVLNLGRTWNVCSEFVNLTLFCLYILRLVDMTYFVISVLSF